MYGTWALITKATRRVNERRQLHSVHATLLSQLMSCGADGSLQTGSNVLPWSAVRVWWVSLPRLGTWSCAQTQPCCKISTTGHFQRQTPHLNASDNTIMYVSFKCISYVLFVTISSGLLSFLTHTSRFPVIRDVLRSIPEQTVISNDNKLYQLTGGQLVKIGALLF